MVVVVIGVLHDMMVKCHLLRRKNDVICVRHEMKMKRNLMRQTNRCGSFPLKWSDISDTHPFLKEKVFSVLYNYEVSLFFLKLTVVWEVWETFPLEEV